MPTVMKEYEEKINYLENEVDKRILAISLRVFERNWLDYIPTYAIILRNDGVIVEANNAFCEALGYTKEEIIGRVFLDFLTPEYKEATKKLYEYNLETTLSDWYYNEYQHKDGTPVPLWWIATHQPTYEPGFIIGIASPKMPIKDINDEFGV